MSRTCGEIHPPTGLRCSMRAGHQVRGREDEHMVRRPGAPAPVVDGCIVLDMGDDDPYIRWRAGTVEPERPSPVRLWDQAGGDPARYVELMIEHGHIVPEADPDGVGLLPCGWPDGGVTP